jgi:leucyl-tRNA synthetase
MSKSRGNVVAPDDEVARWGADTFRAYLMFLGPWEQGGPYDASGISGVYRWLSRVWNITTAAVPTGTHTDEPSTRALRRWTHKTIARVTEDFEVFGFNTIIAALMEFTNELTKRRESGEEQDATAWAEAIETLTLLMAPITPHVVEEIWERAGKPYSVHLQSWPKADASLAADEEVEIAVQVNGKVRDRLLLPPDASEDVALERAKASAAVSAHVSGKEIVRVIYVANRLLNIVVRESPG